MDYAEMIIECPKCLETDNVEVDIDVDSLSKSVNYSFQNHQLKHECDYCGYKFKANVNFEVRLEVDG